MPLRTAATRHTPAAVALTVWLAGMTVATLRLSPLDRDAREICGGWAVGPGAVNRLTVTLWPPGATRCFQTQPGAAFPTDALYVPALEWLTATILALGVYAMVSAMREDDGPRFYLGVWLLLGSWLTWNIGPVLTAFVLTAAMIPCLAYLVRRAS
jgi:hypothetical protein